MKLIRYLIKDLVDEINIMLGKKERKIHLYGIYGYFGLPGSGKTMSMQYMLREYRKRYGDKIYISTNYYSKYQDFPFKSWRMLLKEYDKPLIVAWDEVQNEFNSRDFQSFPIELLTILTQNRKGNGIQIHYTAQRYDRVDKIFRELSMYCCDCKTLLNRLGIINIYHNIDYEDKNVKKTVERKLKIRPCRKIFYVQDDELRESYDSYKMIESAKSKLYVTNEFININQLKTKLKSKVD